MTTIIKHVLLTTTDAKGNTWRVTQRAAYRPTHQLIFFVKSNSQRKLLDQCGEWTPMGWNTSRFVPAAPRVPDAIRQQVEALLKTQAKP
jgi:hypothetical protein